MTSFSLSEIVAGGNAPASVIEPRNYIERGEIDGRVIEVTVVTSSGPSPVGDPRLLSRVMIRAFDKGSRKGQYLSRDGTWKEAHEAASLPADAGITNTYGGEDPQAAIDRWLKNVDHHSPHGRMVWTLLMKVLRQMTPR